MVVVFTESKIVAFRKFVHAMTPALIPVESRKVYTGKYFDCSCWGVGVSPSSPSRGKLLIYCSGGPHT